MNSPRSSLNDLAHRTRKGDGAAAQLLRSALERTLRLEVRCVLQGGAADSPLARPILEECRRVAPAVKRPANPPPWVIEQVVHNLCDRLVHRLEQRARPQSMRDTVLA